VKNAKIVLVAEWDGWCGACAADRPLVLTRTGRQRFRTWLTGAADGSRPLVLTCRLCGVGVDVPLEQDDPPVLVSAEDDEAPAAVLSLPVEVPLFAPAVSAGAAPAVPAASLSDGAVPVPAASAPELAAGRQAVAQAFGALLTQRTAAAVAPQTVPVPAVAPLLPQQRTPSNAGLAELQLLADGLDLLSTGRG